MKQLQLRDFRIGGIVTIHARQLKVVSYKDARTEQALGKLHEGLSILTVPSMFLQVGQLLERLEGAGLRLARFRLVNDGGPVFAMNFSGEDSEGKWRSIQASLEPGCVQQVSYEDLDRYFDRSRYPITAAFDNCTLCVVRPHAVRDGGVGIVLKDLMAAGLEVSAAEMPQLDRSHATEFLEVYKGVLPYYADLVDGMCAGPCVALEVRGPEGVCERVRELCGPHDVDMARYLRPQSFRARLGKDNAQNGVHATDLEDDGEREVSYIFDTLLKAA
eukprot:SRR837773.3184.p2 GENE.SRR837773.3184~~SRR837773.3184.p2  ORF type:complete len:321 (+),score=113.15 SRR837773.3184:142-963(+)